MDARGRGCGAVGHTQPEVPGAYPHRSPLHPTKETALENLVCMAFFELLLRVYVPAFFFFKQTKISELMKFPVELAP